MIMYYKWVYDSNMFLLWTGHNSSIRVRPVCVCESVLLYPNLFEMRNQFLQHQHPTPKAIYSIYTHPILTPLSLSFLLPLSPSWGTGCVRRCWWRETAAETRPRSFIRNGWNTRPSWPSWPRIRNGWTKLKRWVLLVILTVECSCLADTVLLLFFFSGLSFAGSFCCWESFTTFATVECWIMFLCILWCSNWVSFVIKQQSMSG